MTKRRQLPQYYLGSLMVVFLVYFYTVGTYFNAAPLHWTHDRTLSYCLSTVLFVGGLIICQLVFDRLWPRMASKQLLQHKTKAPMILTIAAFVFDLILSLTVAIVLVSFLFRQKSGNGFKVSGWPAGLPFLLAFLYFFLMGRYSGGTLGKRFFGITK
jgi:hypothetical protein